MSNEYVSNHPVHPVPKTVLRKFPALPVEKSPPAGGASLPLQPVLREDEIGS
jgi:hypothetical protein